MTLGALTVVSKRWVGGHVQRGVGISQYQIISVFNSFDHSTMEDDDMEYLEAANEDEVHIPPRFRAETQWAINCTGLVALFV